jgi:hypothetical protein
LVSFPEDEPSIIARMLVFIYTQKYPERTYLSSITNPALGQQFEAVEEVEELQELESNEDFLRMRLHARITQLATSMV